jgi:acyl-coenzyme A synthetase/AMP-(fatty) acid ligase
MIAQFNKLFNKLPHGVEFANLYGPTETNVCTFYRIPNNYDKEKELPIGKILPGLKYKIICEENNDFGELVIFGKCVMKNYWGDSINKIESHWYYGDEGIGYKTGDIVSNDGELIHFIGRKDSIVKLNGYRISLNEISKIILECPCVEQVYVDLYTKNKIKQIIAFVSISEIYKNNYCTKQIKNLCETKLPHYMIPNIIDVPYFPLTDSGKINGTQLIKNYYEILNK